MSDTGRDSLLRPSEQFIGDTGRFTITTPHWQFIGDTYPISPFSPRALSAAAVSPYQWHCRLGHPSSSSLRSPVPVMSAYFNCESCELGKHHCTSFPSRVETRSSSIFDLVHCDVWGPSRIESIGV